MIHKINVITILWNLFGGFSKPDFPVIKFVYLLTSTSS